MSHLADLRKDYQLAGLSEKDLARDPFRQFDRWFQEAEAALLPEPNAVVLATAARDGRPAARTVLLKGLDGRGFVFYTNGDSRKGRELDGNPRATLVFPWIALGRQVIVEGPVAKIPREEAEAYFHSRPRSHQLATWASAQSTRLASRGGQVRRARSAAAAVLEWIPPGARVRRVLAGTPQPPPRPAPLPP
jgi:pyridoxamine 5'-phosphate oxidase